MIKGSRESHIDTISTRNFGTTSPTSLFVISPIIKKESVLYFLSDLKQIQVLRYLWLNMFLAASIILTLF